MAASKLKEVVFVGLSGGVDSAVAAYLLKKKGYNVRAVFMKNFSDRLGPDFACPWKEDQREAYSVAASLNIPISTWSFEKHYKNRVVKYIFSEYRRGRTPNPDIICNKEIKFKEFLHRARKEGADFIATGHYAQLRPSKDGTIRLYKGKDTNKDQSYFLAALDQNQLKRILFPLGRLTKPAVRVLANKLHLTNALRRESQGICFIGEIDIKKFLQTKIKPKAGKIVDVRGKVLGMHEGVYYFTIGQRKGINIGGGPALYVVDKDVKKNLLVVGEKNELKLFSKRCLVLALAGQITSLSIQRQSQDQIQAKGSGGCFKNVKWRQS
jgi:tRNA-uridine 2-sulfurtransferase